VRDAGLRSRMKRLQSEYPRQSRLGYLGKLAKYSGLKFLSARLPYTLFVAACQLLGRDHDSVIGGAARSFAGEELIAAIRRRPAGALLALLGRRLRRFDPRSIGERAALADALFAQMPGVARPGARAGMHTHWVVPVCSPAPEELMRQLWRGGFDATRGTTSLYVVPPAPGEAGRVMAQVVYIPVNPGMRTKALRAVGRIIGDERPRGQS